MDILNLLHNQRWVTDTTFQHLQGYMRQWNCNSYDALVETNLFTQTDLAEALAQSLKIEHASGLSRRTVSPEMLSYFPYRSAVQLTCFPVALGEGGKELKVAFSNPLDLDGLDRAKNIAKMKIVALVAERDEILKAIGKNYPISEQLESHDA